MLLTALLVFAPMQEVATLELVRGAPLANQRVAYWDVTDTYLNSQQPERNFGGEGVLMGGPGKTILLRFGDLRRALGANKVRKASLVLTPSGGESPQLKSIAKVQSPWGEGPIMTLQALLDRNAKERASKGKEPEKETPPLWSATWQSRRSAESPLNWQQAGANGGNDVQAIPGAKLEVKDYLATISGLEDAVQSMLDRPYENHGFALTFSNSVEFFSSQSTTNRPKLIVEIEGAVPKPGPDLAVTQIERSVTGAEATYTARIKNVGDEPTKGFVATWSIREGGGPSHDMPNSIAPGQEATVVLKRPAKAPADPRVSPISLKIKPLGPDASAHNDALEVYEGGKWIDVISSREDLVQEQVRLFNEVVAPHSRYSFAREGALARVSARVSSAGSGITFDPASFLRDLGVAIGLPPLGATQYKVGDRNEVAQRGSADLFPGLMGYGDTRGDASLLGAITLLYEPYWTPMAEAIPTEATGLLSLTDVAVLNASDSSAILSKIPEPVLLRAMDLFGRALPRMELSFFQSKNGKFEADAPAFSVVTDARGTAVLPKRDGGLFGKSDGGNGVFLVSASANGVTDYGYLKLWQLVDAYHRGGPGAAVFDMRFNLPGAPLDPTSDLALEKIVTSSAGTIPPKLAPIVDGDLNTSVELPAKKGDWIEIDLGRDRTIGEIDLAGALWPKFDIMVYATGQKIGDASFWAREIDWAWSAANRPMSSGKVPNVAYRGQPTRVRYLRLVNRSDAGGQLAAVKIIPAKL